MSTRGVIARLQSALPLRFAGRYHHWDSYPTGLGKALWELYRGHFSCDLKAMLKVLVDEHPAGWSQINGTDFRIVPGFKEWHFTLEPVGQPNLDEKTITGEQPAVNQPQCYCHGDRCESEMLLTETNATWSGCEWAYVFLPAGDPRYEVMLVLSSYTPKGHKMIGFFGQGDPKAFWTVVALVGLQGEEPDWWKLEIGEPLQTLSHPKSLGQDTLSMALEKTALGIGPSVHPDWGRPGTYIVLTPAKGPHYVGVQQDKEGGRTYYCTCSPIEEKPSPDCEHSLLVWQYLKNREQAAREKQQRRLEYTMQRLDNSDYAALVWEAGQPRFLLLEQSHYLLSGFPTRGDASRMAVVALAILLDFTGDEVLSLALYRQFADVLMEGVMSPDATDQAVAAENATTNGTAPNGGWWHIYGQKISDFIVGE